jgi:hypothetical protein
VNVPSSSDCIPLLKTLKSGNEYVLSQCGFTKPLKTAVIRFERSNDKGSSLNCFEHRGGRGTGFSSRIHPFPSYYQRFSSGTENSTDYRIKLRSKKLEVEIHSSLFTLHSSLFTWFKGLFTFHPSLFTCLKVFSPFTIHFSRQLTPFTGFKGM